MTTVESVQRGPSLSDFEALRIDPETFNHAAHMFVAWSYLLKYDLATSIQRYRETLQRLTRKFGVPGKFHETITWFYMIVIAERMADQDDDNWQDFVSAHPDLFTREPSLISRFYSDELIASDRARQTFLLPQPQRT